MAWRFGLLTVFALAVAGVRGEEVKWWVPYDVGKGCVERQNVFEFVRKPTVKRLGRDRYEISFKVKGYCDVTVAVVDGKGRVVRHLASGVLGPNAPAPFTKNSLEQRIIWNGKDDLDRYVRQPKRLFVKVMLGLKVTFHRMIGPRDPHNLPGYVLGIAIDEEGAYVFTRGQSAHNQVHVRKFDHDGNYLMSLVPPPSSLPLERLGGRSGIEYAPGKTAHHGPSIREDFGYDGNALPGLGGMSVPTFQPVVIGKKLFFMNTGPTGYSGMNVVSTLYYIYTDGSTDVAGLKGFVQRGKWSPVHLWPQMAASPDGKWIYMVGLTSGGKGIEPGVVRFSPDGKVKMEPFVGKWKFRNTSFVGRTLVFEPGSAPGEFNGPTGIACDGKGRIYVADTANNRLQVFSPAGKFLKAIEVSSPRLVCVHPRTGAVYVQHYVRVRGRSVPRITKFRSFDDPRPEYHVDGYLSGCMALDAWTARPRLWIGGGVHRHGSTTSALYRDRGPSVIILEDTGKGFRKIMDFDEVWKEKAGAAAAVGRWKAGVFDHVVCDPVRNHLYYGIFRRPAHVFDLESGKYLKTIHFQGPVNDIAFDKRGYLHCHLDPGFFMPGIVRLDPSKEFIFRPVGGGPRRLYKEIPYDYGIETSVPNKHNWVGLIPVKDQPGAKFFQDGLGVNMVGEIAEQCNIYYVPRMTEYGWSQAAAGYALRKKAGVFTGPSRYSVFMRRIKEAEKRGERVYSIPRRPGIPLAGATIWVYDHSGELKKGPAVIAGSTISGVQIDEDGAIYFVTNRARLIGGKPFLFGRGFTVGSKEILDPRSGRHPFTATLVKVGPEGTDFLVSRAAVPLDTLPSRPADLCDYGPFGEPYLGSKVWVERYRWMYAGVSPAVSKGCTCASTRFHLDWFKRCWVPEAYRHTIGIVDTAGNLIAHIGRYGNLDDVLRAKPGSTDFGLTLPRFI